MWSRWTVIPYLLTADFVNTGVSAFFAFSGRVLYPYYADAPRILPLFAPDDQIAGGAFMWVAGSLPYLVLPSSLSFIWLARVTAGYATALCNAPYRYEVLEGRSGMGELVHSCATSGLQFAAGGV